MSMTVANQKQETAGKTTVHTPSIRERLPQRTPPTIGRMLRTACCTLACILLSTAVAHSAAPASRTDSSHLPPLRIVYFVPRDRTPIPGYMERIDRVLREVQRFYRKWMQHWGYGPRTFRLDRRPDGSLLVHVVRAAGRMHDYGRNDAGRIRREVKQALLKQGLNIDGEYVAIFQLLLEWRDGRAREIGPFCGGGDHLSGTGWFYDDERLDPGLLSSKAPGGYYLRPCSLGKFNTEYIGGIAHELGHAFGLPHVHETAAELRRYGHALMGMGNHTYGQDLRGEGRGTFLTRASAMMLRYCRAFAGDVPDSRKHPRCGITRLEPSFADGVLTLRGAVESDIPAFGISARNDDLRKRADYDAVGWTCDVASDGTFSLKVGEIHPGRYQLRLLVCHVNGAVTRVPFDYTVDGKGRPVLAVFRYTLPLRQMIEAFNRKQTGRARQLAGQLLRTFPEEDMVCRKARHILDLLAPESPLSPDAVPRSVTSLPLSRLEWTEAETGWGKPMRDRVWADSPRNTCFLEADGRFFEQGLYAHAPARYVFRLDGEWRALTTEYAIQDGHSGSIVFIVRGDGHELARSPVIRDHKIRRFSVDVSGVKRLELVTTDGGDGRTNDWGIWIRPVLSRKSPP